MNSPSDFDVNRLWGMPGMSTSGENPSFYHPIFSCPCHVAVFCLSESTQIFHDVSTFFLETSTNSTLMSTPDETKP